MATLCGFAALQAQRCLWQLAIHVHRNLDHTQLLCRHLIPDQVCSSQVELPAYIQTRLVLCQRDAAHQLLKSQQSADSQ